MAWRFKASKYKNAAPIVPKPENCIRDIVVGSYQNYGNNIAASASFMAFNWDHAGTSVAVLPLDDCGRKSKTMPLLHAHSDTVTDLEFSPFHDGLLATGSLDCQVKLWHIPEQGITTSLTNPECTLSHKQRRIERVGFHPTADFLLHSVSSGTVILWDLSTQQEIYSNNDHPEVIQSISWKRDGTLLSTTCKDKMIRVLDPRLAQAVTMVADSHASIKDSRVVWMGEQNRILSTGFDAQRLRQVIVRDLRMFQSAEASLELDCSTGVLMPLFDADTNMLFLAGKGDSTITYVEVNDKEPFFVEGLRHSGEQTKGACLVPKRALRVMEGEVNRVMQLTSNSVVPIMYQVPRKTYRDFHADLYPDTAGCETELLASHWISGKNCAVPKITLDPAKREGGSAPITVHRGNLKTTSETSVKLMATKGGGDRNGNQTIESVLKGCCSVGKNISTSSVVPTPLPRSSRTNSMTDPSSSEESSSATASPRPSPFPRATVTPGGGGSYKPRLGPKPFAATNSNNNNNGFSFEKVFSVPTAPGNGNHHESPVAVEGSSNGNGSVEDVDEIVDDSPTGVSEEEPPSSSSLSTTGDAQPQPLSEPVLFRAPLSRTTSNDQTDDNGVVVRDSISIADRRKLYELKSISVQEERANGSPTPSRRKNSFKHHANGKREEESPTPAVPVLNPTAPVSAPGIDKRTSTVFGRVSKYRHLKGTPGHKSTQLDNVRNIGRQLPGECDAFHANHERVAIPLAGPGGKIAIYELSKTGRLPDGVIPSLVNSSNVMDFQWDPFNTRRLAVACDDGTVKFWTIPEGGLTEPINSADAEIVAHADKIYMIKFHPCAKDVLVTASYDMTVKVWNTNDTQKERIVLTGHSDQIFSFAWSPCGQYGATVCRDGKVRVYNPRKSSEPEKVGTGPVGSRGARIVWAVDGEFLVVTGFDKVSERQISIYKSTNIETPITTIGLDVTPAILIPFYDEDSSTLFVTGKGDSTIFTFDITDESPYICPLSHHRANSSHQGLSFLQKNHCNVVSVEFAKALRLTSNSVEWLSFSVPRLKSDLFQDDLFPPTRVLWEPSMSAETWFDTTVKDKLPIRISLQPEGMATLSGSRPVAPSAAAVEARVDPMDVVQQQNKGAMFIDSQKQKELELKKALSSRMEPNLGKVLHDTENGVDENEWEE